MGLFIKKNNQLVPVGISAEVVDGTDVSDTTATASDVASGKYFYTAAGVRTEGTASSGTTKTVTINLYNPRSPSAFISCYVQESSDYIVWTNVGQIMAPDGSTTVNLSSTAKYMRLECTGPYVSPPTALQGGFGFGFVGSFDSSVAHIVFVVVDSCQIDIFNINWDD